ncbi:aldehyde dehydrogenase large subunit [Acetobacter aceti NRIC 0242]|uniref:Aldehyde dehydrogenase n=1 Tax=Acetobacter aceti NBRC 14818 TaxID=887700 RepID=A0AB33IHF1_ACEAC|nr:molybdopterin cofactor-binding domain-containing protein [Acetobacter aceti]TCS35226.1 isoquinoline 1-oxidoreductase beta subunit [Acetobacter aceti NBRC 14818]BCK75387.1 aldehyde dehydrogenase [Acetobacter aceti NBRC 14818]GAN57322.1 aldehyde dehydrogenase large subunit [Acetobacter aceti NBRC 14818]GBO81427.1 aldehyde dehydrogenase large subunit [Acetobacter aceti NRIC 0242]
MTRMPLTTRRAALFGGGGLLLATLWPSASPRASTGMLVENATAPFAPNAYIRITPDNSITLILPNIEMGQGIYTSSVMLIAEELGVDLAQIEIEAAPPGSAEITGGSTSIMTEWKPLREAGAAARTVLVQAAASRWNVPPTSCTAASGVVTHTPSGRTFKFGELATEAAKLPLPKEPTLKAASDYSLIGKSQHRVDSAIKVNGTAVFGIDINVPGQKIGTVAASPVIGGTVRSLDRDAAMAVRGVVAVLINEPRDAVCVVAEHYWAAHKGLQALRPVWSENDNAHVNTKTIYDQLHDGLKGPAIIPSPKGDADAVIAKSHSTYSAVYQQPMLAHATMEPINCTAHVRPDGCDVWVGTQVADRAQETAADVTGLPKEKIAVHSQYIGGGFGRRLEHEYITQCVQFAKQTSYPLKIVWSREEDITRDRYRPAYVDEVTAGLDEKGHITAMKHRIVGPAVVARWDPPELTKDGYDEDLSVATLITPYTYDAYRLEFARREAPGVITAWWRGVGGTRGLFVVENFIDELAVKAGADPVAYRRELAKDNARAVAVLDRVAKDSGWSDPVSKGRARGVALQFAFGSYMATVAEIEMPTPETVIIHRVTAAVDCGQVVNPDQVISQIEGGLIFGFSAALYNEITLENGRVQENNFNTWRVMRMNEAPRRIDVHLIASTEDPGGIGEVGTAAAAPALANAMASAQGHRYRTLPLLSSRNQEKEAAR